MKKINNKGFTLVELLAAMGIFALIMALAVPNVLRLQDSNMRQAYVEDANKLIELAKYDVAKYIKNRPVGEDNCSILGLGYLDDSEFDNPPNGGCYDVNRSFIIVQYRNHEYHYYVRLVEAYNDGGNIVFGGIGLTKTKREVNGELYDITKKDVETDIKLEKFDTQHDSKFKYLFNDSSFNPSKEDNACTGTTKVVFGYQSKEYKEVGSGDETEKIGEGICAVKWLM